MKISVYGRPKTGKTRLSSTFPKPLLILGTEDGTESIKKVEGIDFIHVIYNKQEPKGMSDNEWKNTLKRYAIDMIPFNNITLKTADALLIAEYCRKRFST